MNRTIGVIHYIFMCLHYSSYYLCKAIRIFAVFVNSKSFHLVTFVYSVFYNIT